MYEYPITMKSPLLIVAVPSSEENRKTNHRTLTTQPISHWPSPKNKHGFGKVKVKKRVVISTPSGSSGDSSIASSGVESAKSSKNSTKSTHIPPSDHSQTSHLSSQTTKTASPSRRKSRLPNILKFRKKKGDKNSKKKKHRGDEKKKHGDDDDDSQTSSLTRRSKSELLSEFSTLMNEFPTEDTLNTTLHVACAKKYSDQLIVDQLIAKGPSAVTMRNQKRDLPLHCAMKCEIESGVDDRVFRELIKRYPEGVEAANNENCLPIHLACQSGGRNANVCKKLLEAYPLSVIMKCDLKLPFDDRAFDHMERLPHHPRSAKYANDDRQIDSIGESKSDESDSCGAMFWSPFLMLSPKASFEAESNAISSDPGVESDFSPLHLAVIFAAPPDVIEAIITTNPICLGLKTDQGRRAIDCARYAVAGKRNERPKHLSILRVPTDDDEEDELRINRYIKNIDEDPVQNIFAAIEIIKTFQSNQQKSMRLASATTMTANSMRELNTIDEFDPKNQWRKLSNLIKTAGAFQRPANALGRMDPFDANKAVRPSGFHLPDHLNHICVNIKIPVGFRRLRWAMLTSSSDFLPVEVLQNKLKYSEVEMGPWDKHNDEIGSPNLPNTEIQKDFIGAQRKCQYLMPKSGMVSANMAYETHTIVDCNNYAFVTRKVVRNPDVPFGSTFNCIVQTVFINLGYNNCRMVSSVEAEFVGRPPMVAWKIKNAMYNGVTDFFVAKGETICEHAFREGANADAGDDLEA